MKTAGLPPVVDQEAWQRALDALRVREKAATRELDAIAAQRRRLPMVEMPDYVLECENGPVRLADVFDGKSQLIVYNHMWFPGEDWQCPGCTGFTSQFTRLEFLDNYDARFVIVTQGPIDEALAYKRRVGNQMTWYSTANSSFGEDVERASWRWVCGQCLSARRRSGVPDLAYQWPWDRTTESLVRVDRSTTVRPAGRVARLPGRLAAVADV